MYHQFETHLFILYLFSAKLDRKQTAIDDCTMAIKLDDSYVKALLRRAKLYEDTEKLDESLADYNKIVELDPGNREAKAAQCRLSTMIDERNEKLKTEMLGMTKQLCYCFFFIQEFLLTTRVFKVSVLRTRSNKVYIYKMKKSLDLKQKCRFSC